MPAADALNHARLIDYFTELVRIDSLSRREGELARRLKSDLEALGAKVRIDEAGERVGGDTGNVIATIPGTTPGPWLLLSAHMDTVVPGEGVTPVRGRDRITSDGRTILGGDDKSGVAIIMEVLRTLAERPTPHGGIEVAFTICEEAGLLGAKHLAADALKARDGLVLDSEHANFLFTKGPAADKIEFTVVGLEAHSGICPERGISAIKVMSEAIAAMRLGRIDEETTANLGVLRGGAATNIVPKEAAVSGEARSLNEAKLDAQTAHMRRCFADAAERHCVTVDGVTHRARVVERIERDFPRLDVPDEAPIVRAVLEAAQRVGWSVATRSTGGGCDANVFNQKGLRVANLGTGMRAIHTVKEYLLLDEFVRAGEVVMETVRLHAEPR
ncbi:MAG: M20/M25/M40 family metallo-hydrolase [Nitrospirota bacterium]